MRIALFFAIAGLATVLIGHSVMHSIDVTVSGTAVTLLGVATLIICFRDEWNGSK